MDESPLFCFMNHDMCVGKLKTSMFLACMGRRGLLLLVSYWPSCLARYPASSFADDSVAGKPVAPRSATRAAGKNKKNYGVRFDG